MLSEEIRAKLVQRADDVAELEEVEHFIQKVFEELQDITAFRVLHQMFERYEVYRRAYYVCKPTAPPPKTPNFEKGQKTAKTRKS